MITSVVKNITPEAAAKMLSHNIQNNRRLNRRRVSQYADDMKNGRWVTTGSSIQFDEDGLLIDGQHRLQAVILSGCEVPMLVTTGLKREAVQVIDTNQPRTLGQIQKLNSVTGLKANRYCLMLGQAYIRIVDGFGEGNRLPYHLYDQWYEDHKQDIHEFFGNVTKHKTVKVKAGTLLALFMAMKAGVSADDLNKFVEAYDGVLTTSERNVFPIKLKMLSCQYASKSTGKLELISERYINSFVKNLSKLAPEKHYYTKED